MREFRYLQQIDVDKWSIAKPEGDILPGSELVMSKENGQILKDVLAYDINRKSFSCDIYYFYLG